jgi:hypothetical protein
VFLVALVALAGILTMFIRPLASEGPQFIDRVPSYVEQARTGRGPVGDLVQRYNLDEYLQRNQARLRESANRLTTPALGVLRSIFSTVVALVTIFVLTFLMARCKSVGQNVGRIAPTAQRQLGNTVRQPKPGDQAALAGRLLARSANWVRWWSRISIGGRWSTVRRCARLPGTTRARHGRVVA